MFRYENTLALLFAGIALLLNSTAAFAGAFDEARTVYNRGDFGTAREMFRPLAQQGDRFAQTMMGHFSAGGRGFPPDLSESAKWYRLAATQGEPIAQYQMYFLEHALSMEEGRPTNYTQTIDWLRQSAEQDFPASQWLLSNVLRDKKTPVPKSEAESFKWIRRAGDFDAPLVHLELAQRYAKGEGTAIDLGEAYFWASLVALYVDRVKGDPSPASKLSILLFSSGTTMRDKIGAELAPEQRAALDRRVAAWKPRALPPFKTLIQTPAELARGARQMPGAFGAPP